MQLAPLFHLYGETSSKALTDGMHVESIADRSKLYDWEISAHRHENLLQVLHISKGKGQIHLGSSVQMIAAPCFVLIPRLQVHGFRFDRKVRGTVMSFAQHQLDHLLSIDRRLRLGLDQARQISLAADSQAAQSAASTVLQLQCEFQGSAHWREHQLKALTLALFIAIGRQLPIESSGSDSDNRAVKQVIQFKQLIDENFRTALAIGDYASRLGISSTRLNRACRKVVNKSALQLVHERLLTEACRDLTFTLLSMKQIAFALGFQDESYFTRFFKTNMGSPPLEYRRKSGARLQDSRTLS